MADSRQASAPGLTKQFHIHQIWTWNAAIPDGINECVHTLIAETASRQPEAPAVCAWDGGWTYSKLDQLSTHLAHWLVNLGVSSETIVPLCFEKSKWMPVAMLAVMKAGAASVAIDTNQPEERLRSVVQQVEPIVILCSSAKQCLASRLAADTTIANVIVDKVVVDAGQLDPSGSNQALPIVSPSSRLYVVFTSGSTGSPKGVVISHANYSSAIHYQQSAHGFKPTSRVYDFASYAFDVSWSNVLQTLTVGGCLCIPSDDDRSNDLAGSIDRLGATHADLTPSIAQILPESAFNKLHTIVLGGEKLPKEHAQRWASMVDLKNPYGPSECTPTATIATIDPDKMYNGTIGKVLGLNAWVVDPVTEDSLVPIGSTGELWLEGPLVGAGYLGDPDKTAATFIQDPPWLLCGGVGPEQPGRRGRLYKTGDLVRQASDGSLIFVGRGDAQVKINGQRVELGDVEHHVRANLPERPPVRQVVADMIVPSTSSSAILVAFLETGLLAGEDAAEANLHAYTKSVVSGLNDRLAARIPSYMIPSIYIPVMSFPLTPTGKTDRRQLHAIGEAMPLEELSKLKSTQEKRRQPGTPLEKKLRSLWSSVLGKSEESIGVDDSFLQSGGDSIAAMQLVGRAREQGLSLTVADIFTRHRLEDLAKAMTRISEPESPAAHPCSLLRADADIDRVRGEAAELCGISPAQIEDVFPCTPLQEGLLSLSEKRPGAYIVRYALELRSDVDLQMLRKAWEAVFRATPILRTRIVSLGGEGLVQAVVDEQTMAPDKTTNERPMMGLGTPLAHFELIKDSEKDFFVWTMHHALYDGWSIRLVLEQLERAYKGEAAHPSPAFQGFIKHIVDVDEEQVNAFWTEQFLGSEAQVFPALPSANYQPKSDQLHKHTIMGARWPKTGITASSAIRAAFAILISEYTGSKDVVLGVTSSGRQAAVSGVEQMIAPTITTVPVRIAVDRGASLEQLLQQVQSQMIEMTPFEQTGLQLIRRVSAEAERACQFQMLLVVQPAEEEEEPPSNIFCHSNEDLRQGDSQGFRELDTYAIAVECQLSEQGVQLHVSFDSNVMGGDQVKRLLQQFEHVLRQVCESEDGARVTDIEAVSKEDMCDIWTWNATVPESVEICVHDLIAQTVRQQPKAPAVCAWDGDLTYGELDDLSTQLAHCLVRMGVGADNIVPLCFEKSKWTSIAMLAVMKAGGASVAIDTSQPEERLHSIVQQVDPVLILSSSTTQELASQLTTAPNVMVCEAGFATLASLEGNALPIVSPSSRLYLVFTSGSTGTPKGVVITHSNYSSAVHYQQAAHGFEPTSRVYDFASYAFDVSWSNFIHTLAIGGCLCIPSDSDRRDDLAGSIDRLKATHADLTPSAASVLPEETFKSLKTLVLGGEKLSTEYAERWSALVTLKNPYGPSECTPTATLETIKPQVSFKGSIGKGLGFNTWLVDAANGESLVPIGSTGELWLEGPLVGAGYHGDPERTASAFVNDPLWLLRGGPDRPGRSGRLYKTGDLVRYNSDGSLAFIGRKDAQVKINGQRVELSEIENHIGRYEPIRQHVCLLPQSGPCANKLVGIVSLKGLERGENETHEEIQFVSSKNSNSADDHLNTLRSLLNETLPSYMVPSVWIALSELPLSTSGKLNHKALQTWLINMESQTFARVTKADQNVVIREPRTEIERILVDACSCVLNVLASSIDLQRPFIAIGGDSISAMRLASRCRTYNLAFSVSQLLKSKSLAEFARLLNVVTTEAVSHQEAHDTLFGLSPIQQWFFDQSPIEKTGDMDHYCNQGFYLKVKGTLSATELDRAIGALVDHHSMLRARFERTKDYTWKQRIPKANQGHYHFAAGPVSSLLDVAAITMERHRNLDIQAGPVFVVDLCILSTGEQYLAMVAHHLVIDLVSWRILLEDLETLFKGGKLQPSLPFQIWSKLQIERATELKPENTLSTSGINNNLDFWDFGPSTPNTNSDQDSRLIKIDRQTTTLVLGDANRALKTEPVELLLSAVWDAFLRVFPQRDGLTIFSEGHGREPWNTEIDASRTVGWFTTISPIHISRDAAPTTANIVRLLKDARRRLPSNGWDYFTSRYLNSDGKDIFKNHNSVMEVTFNYHGQFQQLEGGDSLFEAFNLDGVSEQGSGLPAGSLFSIEVSIEAGKACFAFSFNRHITHQNLILQWIAQIGPSLQSICEELVSSATSRTLCDYEFLSLDYRGLDKLHNEIIPKIESVNHSAIEDVYPCTPTVDGILLAQVKHPQSYKTVQMFEINSRDSTASLDRLSEAWQRVVARQPSLRTVFIGGLDAKAAFNQVVLKEFQGEVVLLCSKDDVSALDSLKLLTPADYQELRPPHRVVLCQTPSKVLCQIEMSHAITDGASTNILAQDWIEAYAGNLDSMDLLRTTRNFTQSLLATPYAEKLAFWKSKLVEVEPCDFPHLSKDYQHGERVVSNTTSARIGGHVFNQIQQFCTEQSVTPASLLQSVWALTLAAYTGTSTVCFGYLASGRDLPISGLDESVGAYTNMMICRADIQRPLSGRELVRQIHEQTMQDLAYQHCSLAAIQHELNIPSGQPLFNSIVSFQKQADVMEAKNRHGLVFKTMDGEDSTEYEIVVNIGHGAEEIHINFDYSRVCLTEAQANRVVSLFQSTAVKLVNEQPIESASNEDMSEMWTWNSSVPEEVNVCVHDLIAETTRLQPNAPAVCAWDGDWTYSELDSRSTQLAHRLVELGVGSSSVVPLCFEKGKWTPVAMMAVMKAGGASVALDTAQPEERLRSIVRQVESTVMLCSSAKQELAGRLVSDAAVAVVNDINLLSLTIPDSRALPVASPSDRLYVVFTSGSTGTPKGVVVTHANISSAIRHQREALGFTPGSRVFDFASYTFDVVWCDILQGLSAGSCICIPSDADRKSDFIGAITKLDANLAIFTPSAIRGLDISALNNLRNLHFIGEPLKREIFETVDEEVTVSNLYGPTECTTYSTVQRFHGREPQAIGIGKGSGLNTWVVDPVTGDSLVPVGATGELLLEGPLVAAGYLNDPMKTAAAFIESPAWLLRGAGPNQPGRSGRMYKTGDLVHYNADGSLSFVGRKDAQVKINGQRVELGDVEHHVQSHLLENNNNAQVVAEVIRPVANNAMLVAFISIGENVNEAELLALTKKATNGLDEKLAAELPPHMIPGSYISLAGVPKTPSGKTDRRRLREMGEKLSWEQLTGTDSSQQRRQPNTSMEKQLRALWASVLGLDVRRIGATDSFLRIGGDSIGAMRLVGAAREHGLSVSVADIFRNPRLCDLARLVGPSAGPSEIVMERFSLLKPGSDVAAVVQEAAAICGVEPSQIEDIYPSTPLQEGLLALTAKRPGDYITRCVLELKSSVDLGRFRQAWETVIATTEILRTRIADLAGQGLAQVVVDQQPQWALNPGSGIHAYMQADEQRTTSLGAQLMRYALVEGAAKQHFFIWTIHHAIYDGWSMSLVLDKLERAYRGDVQGKSPDFRRFVKHVAEMDRTRAASFWVQQLGGSEAQIFPALPSATYQPKSDQVINHRIEDLQWPTTDITASTVVRAAFSILAAQYSDSRDVVFGATATGRQAAVPGVEAMVGPTIATVPVRIVVVRETSLEQLLGQIQAQGIEMTAFEQTGLQHIRRVNGDAERACRFQTLLIVQPAEETAKWHSEIIAQDLNDARENGGDAVQESETYAMTLECHLGEDKLRLRASFDSTVVGEEQVRRLAQQFEHVLRQICAYKTGNLSVSDIETLSKEDLRDIWTWNASVPETSDECMHDLIAKAVLRQPQATAVSAWDGEWTYAELGNLSTRLAHHLLTLGIGPGSIVPLCFQKSRWMPVAMLGVMKAGGASVAMDSMQPEGRLRSIVNQVDPALILCSASRQGIAGRLAKNTLVIDDTSLSNLVVPGDKRPLPVVDPSSMLYLVFTSGSTGTPKGVMITHSNFSSAIMHQQKAQGINSESRVFDFASYAFDVSWANALTSFERGACLCIPSDSDRKDDLTGAILRLGATHADLTPSAASVLSEEALCQLHTMTLGGERLSADSVKQWSNFVSVKNSYGPSECTPTATFTESLRADDKTWPSIGRGTGLNTWIVDAATGESLVPIGCVGELLLEGPLVGAGYLGDPRKTAAAFIEDPAWLLQGDGLSQPGRQGRLYRTGDLAQYNSNGSLAFVGRKDAQVKINGQRVELSETETSIGCYEATRQAACLLPRSGFCANRLVGVFSLKGLYQDDTDASEVQFVSSKYSAMVGSHVEGLKSRLEKSLPSYMVPSVWIALNDLPMTASGKLNHKMLEIWLTNMDPETYAKVMNTDRGLVFREPKSEIERIVRDACSYVLNIPAAEISLDRSFIANGGDSISAMRLVSHCRAANITFSVANLLQSHSVAQITLVSAEASTTVSHSEYFDTLFALSPIQEWYFTQSLFDRDDAKDRYYNQGFYLKLKDRLSSDKIEHAIAKVVEHHSMLRARFQVVNGSWMQTIPKSNKSLYHFGFSELPTLLDVESLAMEKHRTLDIENGPVFSADLCTLPTGEQYLVLIAHHLVLDLVSWRIILEDLERLLTSSSSQALQRSVPFQTWIKLQIEKASSSCLKPENVLSTVGIRNDLGFWGFQPDTPNTLRDHNIKSFDIDQSTTSLLLGYANNALNTEPVELLLAAAWNAFLRVFPQRDGLTIFSEGHGREPWTADIDLSKTVGWFTTISPINIARSKTTLSTSSIVRLVKDARRRLPANGWAYFTSRFLNKDGQEAFKAHNSTMEVVFNYQGQFQQLEQDNGLFEDVHFERVCEQGPALPASALFEIEVSIEDGTTHFAFTFNRHIQHQDLIVKWINQVGPSLKAICSDLASTKESRTLCDYEFLRLDYHMLDELQAKIIPHIESLNESEIEDVYPCTPTVDGILLSQVKQPNSYKTLQLYEITAPDSKSISLDGLSSAWRKVVAHQPALRTVFIEGLDATAAFNQVVLKSFNAEVVTMYAEEEAAALHMLRQLHPVKYQQARPPHRVSLCQTANNKVVCQIEMSHAITDGASTNILVQEWINAYAGNLSSTDLLNTTRVFTRAVVEKPYWEKLAFWKEKLTETEPCHFPHLSSLSLTQKDGKPIAATGEANIRIGNKLFGQIQQFCTVQLITPASFLNSVWALTLAAYTGTRSVCFGYFASGRDMSIPGLYESIGAYMNMMICRADIQKSALLGHQFVQQLHEQFMKDLGYQHCSLAAIQHEVNLPSGHALFNSIISFQKQNDDYGEPDDTGEGLVFKGIDGEDPTEYDIALSINYATQWIDIDMDFSPLCLTRTQADRVLSLFQAIAAALIQDQPINAISQEDANDIWAWNADVPEPIDVCLHDLIEQTTQRQPQAIAVCAWDGDWTYAELGQLSTRFAHHLATLGIGSESIVPLCFEKSKWTPVAMLAVMKAGGASVAMDASQPKERLRSIVQQANAVLVLSSSDKQEIASRLTKSPVVVVNNASLLALPSLTDIHALPTVNPSSRLYIVFTSGSSGTPKGVVITHSNYSSAIHHQQAVHGFQPTSRVYDFASYAFDVSWSNILHTLTIGGCLCIPSDTDRKDDLAGSIDRLKATHIDITPSAASILPSKTYEKLTTVVLGGEELPIEQAKQWSAWTNLKNPYGPSECTPTATITPVDASFKGGIGRGYGLNTWVVEPIAGESLLPIGLPGELWLEGPLVGAGYLGDAVKTATAFVEDPPWLLQGGGDRSGRHGRLYKTGDLVRYNMDGTLTFIGRKDAQVKINGQRVELGDIEYHVRACLSEENSDMQVVAEVINPQQSSKAMLVAFIAMNNIAGRSISEEELLGCTKKATAKLEEKLATRLPAYMIPLSYIPLVSFPITATGKMDRRGLREVGRALTWKQLAATSSSQQEQREPNTSMERQLQKLWSSVLGTALERIGVNDNFLRSGGDSIGAMRLASTAREQGISLSVTDILKRPKLGDMALMMRSLDSQEGVQQPPVYEPFSLLPANLAKEELAEHLQQIGILKETVTDILPVTDQQARCIALTYTASRNMLLYHTLDGNGTPDILRMRAACAALVKRFDMLRTVFIGHKDAFLQVVLKQLDIEVPIFTTADNSLDEYTEMVRQHEMGTKLLFGAPLTGFAIMHQTRDQKYRLVVRMSHAQHDGMSLMKMWNAFEEMYNFNANAKNSNDVPRDEAMASNYSNHIRALASIDREAAKDYWRNLLQGSSITNLKRRTTHTLSYGDGPCVVREMPRSTLPSNDFTFSTILKAAWAYVLARTTASDDIVFSSLTHGRSLPGSQEVFGACINIVPTRVTFSAGWRARDLVAAVNMQQIASMQYEHIGSREIVRDCTGWPRWSYAGSVVYYHNFDDGEYDVHDRGMHMEDLDLTTGDVDMVDVHVTAKPSGDKMRIEMSFAADILSERQAQLLVAKLCETIIMFYNAIDMPLRSPQELRTLPATLPANDAMSNGAATRSTSEKAELVKNCPDAAREALEAAWSAVFSGAVAPGSDESRTLFDLGGDLVCASLLSAHMERQGYSLGIEEIFENPTWGLQLALLGKKLQPDASIERKKRRKNRLARLGNKLITKVFGRK